MKLLKVEMPEDLIEGMDEAISKWLFPSRGPLIWCALRELLKRDLKQIDDENKNKEIEYDGKAK
jgi:metal-responsive CopG/Arc/MetJ family transcriptional regulator